MKKFGFGKKGSEGDDPNRSAIFGSRSAKKSSLAPASSNPYAQTSQPPDPYTQAKYNAGIGALPAGQYGPNPGRGEGYSGGGGGYGSDNKDGGMNGRGPGTDNKYGAGTGTGGGGGGGYGTDRYGSQNGYGADRYGAGA
ncbi:MAG: hypothetical protein M1830_002492, partial [Pleopsidium flavum]